MKFETAFEKAFGRRPTRPELDRLQRVKDAFGVGDNDALMTIAALLVFYDSGAVSHLQQGARLLQSALQQATPRATPPTVDASGPWRAAVIVCCAWVASMAFVSGLALSLGSSMTRSYPCWVPQGASDRLAVAILGAPTGWLVLLASAVPAVFAGAWGLSRGMDESRARTERWIGWAACAGMGVAVLTWLALVLVKIPRAL